MNLRIDLTLLDFGGNVIDTCCIAAMAALSHFRRPEFIVNGDEVRSRANNDDYSLELYI